MSSTVAALFVEGPPRGVYCGLPDVDPWSRERDARQYAGPHPVVAHPPCERWGRYYGGGPSASVPRHRGDDGGCFAAALWAVRTFGGVLEHPADTSAWPWFGLRTPPRSGGWVGPDEFGGWTCRVEQGHYGHRARKGTWLYACGVELPSLRWGAIRGRVRLEDGFHPAEERREARAAGLAPCERLSHEERAATPLPFRDLLLDIARSAHAHPRTEAAP